MKYLASISRNARATAFMMVVSLLGLWALMGATRAEISADWVTSLRWLPLTLVITIVAFGGTLKLPQVNVYVSVSNAVVFFAAIMGGPGPAIILSAMDGAFQSIQTTRRWQNHLFNIGNLCLAAWASTVVSGRFFPGLIHHSPATVSQAHLALGLPLMAVIYYVVNAGSIATYVSIKRGVSIFGVWRDSLLWPGFGIIVGASATGLVCLTLHLGTIYATSLVAPLLLTSYFGYKIYRDKAEAASKNLNELRELYRQVSSGESQWKTTFSAMSDVILLFNNSRCLTRFNSAALVWAESLGIELVEGLSCCSIPLICQTGHCTISEVLKNGNRYHAETTYDQYQLLITGDPLYREGGELFGTVFVIKDITGLRSLRNQLIHSEKMSAVGQLISGVAHELNNPLTSVIGYAELTVNARTTAAQTRSHLEIVLSEAERARKIVKNLLTFARQTKPNKAPLQINEVVSRVMALRSYELRVNSIIVKQHLAELPLIMGDSGQLQQVVLNIVINAEQAMLAGNCRGALDITTSLKGDRVLISIADDGPGIEPKNLNKIFDPFFTTKPIGQGTGLGLALSYGIVVEHGGTLEVQSEVGVGTIFTINLPAGVVEDELQTLLSELPGAIQEAGSPQFHLQRRILVVDDEDFVAEIIRTILEREGHWVETANNGRVALDRLDEASYDLIITDYKMPEMTGADLYSAVKSRDPELAGRIIFVTGDTVNDETRQFIESTGNYYMAKPFSLDELLEIVDKAALCKV